MSPNNDSSMLKQALNTINSDIEAEEKMAAIKKELKIEKPKSIADMQQEMESDLLDVYYKSKNFLDEKDEIKKSLRQKELSETLSLYKNAADKYNQNLDAIGPATAKPTLKTLEQIKTLPGLKPYEIIEEMKTGNYKNLKEFVKNSALQLDSFNKAVPKTNPVNIDQLNFLLTMIEQKVISKSDPALVEEIRKENTVTPENFEELKKIIPSEEKRALALFTQSVNQNIERSAMILDSKTTIEAKAQQLMNHIKTIDKEILNQAQQENIKLEIGKNPELKKSLTALTQKRQECFDYLKSLVKIIKTGEEAQSEIEKKTKEMLDAGSAQTKKQLEEMREKENK
jgi:hypothetical protein